LRLRGEKVSGEQREEKQGTCEEMFHRRLDAKSLARAPGRKNLKR
jgi:hypothetical protein